MKDKVTPDELEWNEGRVKNFYGKDLIAMENGSLKLVKVAPFASYPEHQHPDKTEYAYILEGNPHFVIGDNSYSGKPKDFFIFPQGIKHAIQNKTYSQCLLLIGAIKN